MRRNHPEKKRKHAALEQPTNDRVKVIQNYGDGTLRQFVEGKDNAKHGFFLSLEEFKSRERIWAFVNARGEYENFDHHKHSHLNLQLFPMSREKYEERVSKQKEQQERYEYELQQQQEMYQYQLQQHTIYLHALQQQQLKMYQHTSEQQIYMYAEKTLPLVQEEEEEEVNEHLSPSQEQKINESALLKNELDEYAILLGSFKQKPKKDSPPPLKDEEPEDKEVQTKASPAKKSRRIKKKTTDQRHDRQSHFNLSDPAAREKLGEAANFTYTHIDGDKVELVEIAPLDIISSENQTQYGAYALTDIKKGTVLCRYAGKKYSADTKRQDRDYFMACGEFIIDAKEQGNIARFVNDSTHCPNIVFQSNYDLEKNEDYIELVALEDIPAGASLYANYREDFVYKYTKKYLHSSDNYETADDRYLNSSEYYHPDLFYFDQLPLDLTALGIKRDDKAFLPIPMFYLLVGDSIPKDLHFDKTYLSLLRLGNNEQFIENGQQERVTTLMVATYLGKYKAIIYLLNEKADPKIQQTFSGRTALHFLLMGAKNDSEEHKKARLKALNFLLGQKDLLNVADCEKKAALITAIEHAPTDFLFTILNKVDAPTILKQLKSCDKDGFDPLLYALMNNKYEHARMITEWLITKGKANVYLTHFKNIINKLIKAGFSSENISSLINKFNELKKTNNHTFASSSKQKIFSLFPPERQDNIAVKEFISGINTILNRKLPEMISPTKPSRKSK